MKPKIESFSKKGYGNGFISKSKRFDIDLDHNSLDYIYAKAFSSPGPG